MMLRKQRPKIQRAVPWRAPTTAREIEMMMATQELARRRLADKFQRQVFYGLIELARKLVLDKITVSGAMERDVDVLELRIDFL